MKTLWLGIAYPALALLLAAAPAHAQAQQNPAPQAAVPSTPPKFSGPGSLGTADVAWMRQASRDGLFEAEMSRAAGKKAQARQVRRFAQTLVREQGRVTDDLHRIAHANEVLLPDQLDPAQQRVLARLQSLSGAAFDAAYLKAIQQANQTDLASEHNESRSAEDRALLSFLKRKEAADRKVERSVSRLQPTEAHRKG